jgi:hypothetical protein
MLALSGIVTLQAVYGTGKDCGTALTLGYIDQSLFSFGIIISRVEN